MDDLTYLKSEIATHLRLRDNRKCGIDPKRLGHALARVIARSNNDPEMLAAIRCSIDGRDEDDDGNWNDSAAIENW
jgi:hypothetical protein